MNMSRWTGRLRTFPTPALGLLMKCVNFRREVKDSRQMPSKSDIRNNPPTDNKCAEPRESCEPRIQSETQAWSLKGLERCAEKLPLLRSGKKEEKKTTVNDSLATDSSSDLESTTSTNSWRFLLCFSEERTSCEMLNSALVIWRAQQITAKRWC